VEFKTEVREILSPSESRQDEWLLALPEDQRHWKVYLRLCDGRIMGADFVVSATGVSPSGAAISVEGLGLVEEGESKGAIIVNSRMETNVKDLYAAGDVCKVQLLAQLRSVKP
jgi:pyruvate/2-oxoglutarate dehydrogenase complex dihydrolipoamide dehydrogenase (E3) component